VEQGCPLKNQGGNIMIINHNLMANNALRNMNVNSNNASKSMEKLSSGLRINRAGDDAAGLAISEKMRSQIRGLDQAANNAQDAISMIQTAEGGLNETTSILQRMRELSVQASTNVLAQQDADAIGDEMVALRDEIDRIGNTTDFNGKKLLNGSMATAQGGSDTMVAGAAAEAGKSSVLSVDVSSAKAGSTFTVAQGTTDADLKLTLGGVSQEITLADTMFNAVGKNTVLNFDKLGVKITLQSSATTGTAANAVTVLKGLKLTTGAGSSAAQVVVGSNATTDETISVAFGDMRASSLDSHLASGTLTKTSLETVDNAKLYTNYIDNAIKAVSTQRSNLGAYQNRLEHTIANLNTSSENTTAAESRIRDVDMAKEMSEYSKNNILSQAAQAMLAQANQQPQQVLQLLR
jgi:flagellin